MVAIELRLAQIQNPHLPYIPHPEEDTLLPRTTNHFLLLPPTTRRIMIPSIPFSRRPLFIERVRKARRDNE